MQPFFEQVGIPQDRSWLLYDRQLAEFPFNWHYHPEYELTLTLNSRGMRFVGDSVEPYGDGDLVLLAPNVPHAWQSGAVIAGHPGPGNLHRALVCWFDGAWAMRLTELIPELAPVAALLDRARRGLAFGQATSDRLRDRMLAMPDLPEMERAIEMQAILGQLARAPDARPLAAGEIVVSQIPRDRDRMQRVLDWLHLHYREPLRLAPLCDRANLTESQLQRVFKRATRMSISQYVNQLRLGQACQLLVRTDRSMALIATDCGFSDAAHFARQFRAARSTTPSRYRAMFRHAMTE